jgi:hypothetical protein
MKQKDIALIIVIIAFSVGISYMVSKSLIAPAKNLHQQVEDVKPITTAFDTPSKAYFNDQSINPTKLVHVDQANNADPFSKSQ